MACWIPASATKGGEEMKRLLPTRSARLGLYFLLCEIAIVLLVPLLFSMDGITTVGGFWESPSLRHPLGTDDVGRDLLARTLLGGRISLLVGGGAATLSVGIGLPLGLLAGYRRGAWEFAIMRLADICQAFPGTVLILCVVAITGPSVWILILVLGLLGWAGIARLVYAGTLKVRELPYLDAARLSGVCGARLLWQEILPNIAAPVLPAAAQRAGRAILSESSLSFLGAGIRAPHATWGNIIHLATSLTVLAHRPWVWLVPGGLTILTVLALNAVGEGIQTAIAQEGGRRP